MSNYCIDQIMHICEKYGLEIILNDGEVKGFERLEVSGDGSRHFYIAVLYSASADDGGQYDR